VVGWEARIAEPQVSRQGTALLGKTVKAVWSVVTYKGNIGGEARIAEPQVSRQDTALLGKTVKAVWSVAT
jgi:hypothetical protein